MGLEIKKRKILVLMLIIKLKLIKLIIFPKSQSNFS